MRNSYNERVKEIERKNSKHEENRGKRGTHEKWKGGEYGVRHMRPQQKNWLSEENEQHATPHAVYVTVRFRII